MAIINKSKVILLISLCLIGLIIASLHFRRPYFTRSRVNVAIENGKFPLSSMDLLIALSPYDRCDDVLDTLWEAAVSNDEVREENSRYWLTMIASGNLPIGSALGLSEEEWKEELQSFLLRQRQTTLEPTHQQILARLETLLK